MGEIKPIALKDCAALAREYRKQADQLERENLPHIADRLDAGADALDGVAMWARNNNTENYRTALIKIRDMVLSEKDPDDILGYINIMLDRG